MEIGIGKAKCGRAGIEKQNAQRVAASGSSGFLPGCLLD